MATNAGQLLQNVNEQSGSQRVSKSKDRDRCSRPSTKRVVKGTEMHGIEFSNCQISESLNAGCQIEVGKPTGMVDVPKSSGSSLDNPKIYNIKVNGGCTTRCFNTGCEIRVDNPTNTVRNRTDMVGDPINTMGIPTDSVMVGIPIAGNGSGRSFPLGQFDESQFMPDNINIMDMQPILE